MQFRGCMMINESTLEIRKELLLRAPKTSVWNAIVTPEGWTGWFSEKVEGEFRVGETLALDFGKHGKCWAIVTERVELRSFAYRWHPGEDCPLDKYSLDEMSTVRFELEDHPEGTKLTLVESGFENIPESRRDKCVELNSGGWDWELEEFRAFVEEGIRNSKREN